MASALVFFLIKKRTANHTIFSSNSPVLTASLLGQLDTAPHEWTAPPGSIPAVYMMYYSFIFI
jgi:hypothetical protein